MAPASAPPPARFIHRAGDPRRNPRPAPFHPDRRHRFAGVPAARSSSSAQVRGHPKIGIDAPKIPFSLICRKSAATPSSGNVNRNGSASTTASARSPSTTRRSTTSPSRPHGHPAIQKRVPHPLSSRPGHNKVLGKQPRIRGAEPVPHLVINVRCRSQRKPIQMLPTAREPRLQHQLLARRSQPHDLMQRLLLQTRLQTQRSGRRLVPEPHIRQEWPLRQINPQIMCVAGVTASAGPPRTTRATRLVTSNPSAIRPARSRALCSKQYPPRREATIFACSEATSSFGARPQERINVFKRDGRAVRRDQPAQRRQARLPRASVADPIQVSVQVECGFGHVL